MKIISHVKVNDFALGYKGLDFAYIMMITLMKIFRKLHNNYVMDVDIMLKLFDSFILYEYGPIKNQTSALLIELYLRLTPESMAIFA
jgi:hypothetical protein